MSNRTTHDSTCGCCNGPATVTLEGETFYGGMCRSCGPLLSCPPYVLAELVKRKRAAAPRGEWVMVPREPTGEMLDAAAKHHEGEAYLPVSLWRSMLAVAPHGREVAWQTMDTAPRDGTVIRMRWGSDHTSLAWWDYPVAPIQREDGTWPRDTGDFPWAFIESEDGSSHINHATDKVDVGGPSHWAPYDGSYSATANAKAEGVPTPQTLERMVEALRYCARQGVGAADRVITKYDLECRDAYTNAHPIVRSEGEG